MKFITNIKEFAKEVNFNHVPVITFDLSKPMKGYENCYAGSDIQVQSERFAKNNLTARCTAKMFGDENEDLHDTPWMYKKIGLYEGAVCLKGSHGLEDIKEDIHWSNTRVIKEGDPVLVVFENIDTMYIRKMKCGRVRDFVFPVAVLADEEE